jgi:hypothetical protein
MRTFYSILIFLAISFSSFGKSDPKFFTDTVKTPIVLKATFPELMADCIENNNAYLLAPALPDFIPLIIQYKDPKTNCDTLIDQSVSREYFLDSFQDLLFTYSKGQAELESGQKDGFKIYVLRIHKENLPTSTFIFLLKEGKVVEIYFY